MNERTIEIVYAFLIPGFVIIKKGEIIEAKLQEDFDDANSKAYPRQFKKILMIPIVKHIQDNSRRF